jgi:alpha-N-arabinofuranosidase
MYSYNEESLPALTVSASKDANDKVHISFTNIDTKNGTPVAIDLNKLELKNMTGSLLSSKNLQDHNSFENPNKIEPKNFKDFKFKKGMLEVTVPPFSVLVLEGTK